MLQQLHIVDARWSTDIGVDQTLYILENQITYRLIEVNNLGATENTIDGNRGEVELAIHAAEESLGNRKRRHSLGVTSHHTSESGQRHRVCEV